MIMHSVPMLSSSGSYRTPAPPPSFRALRFPFSSSLGVCYRTTISPLSCSSNNVQPAPVITGKNLLSFLLLSLLVVFFKTLSLSVPS